jgi:hypothetical protein
MPFPSKGLFPEFSHSYGPSVHGCSLVT